MDNDVRRIGVVVPPGNVAMERELPLYLPRGIVTSHNRLSRPTPAVTKESLMAMVASLDQTVRALMMCYPAPEVIIYGCTSGSFVMGPGRESELADKITQITGVPAYTTSSAVIMALREVQAQRVYMVTPYIDDVNTHEIACLNHHGIAVEACDAFGCLDTRDIARISSEQVAELVMRHSETARRCDAVFISCTNLLTMDQIDCLERELQVPVVTSNQCSLWAALLHMRIDASAAGPGRLFKQMGGKFAGAQAAVLA